MLRSEVEGDHLGCFIDSCDRMLGSWRGLSQHMRKSHQAVPIQWELCDRCGSMFTINQADETYRVYCSYRCRGEVQSEEFLGEGNPAWTGYDSGYGDNWAEVREVVRERDQYKCRWCKVRESDLERQLVVHHLIPKNHFEEVEASNDPRNLLSICLVCHQKIEANIPQSMKQEDGSMSDRTVKSYLDSTEEHLHGGQTPEEAYVL